MSTIATFAGGCFWCMEPPFERLEGVVSVTAGYTGGRTPNPTYEQVCSGGTGHAEAVQICHDPSVVSYEELLEVFWRQIDPTDGGGQFADQGSQYRAAIFYHTPEQRRLAERSREELARSGRFAEIVTPIVPANAFFPAEEHHQGFHSREPSRYESYRRGSGRQSFLERTWRGERKAAFSKLSDEELRQRLTPPQYRVVRGGGTEPPFENEHWDQKAPGIYVDVASGEPLFSSLDKFDSGTGWPSFSKPLDSANIVLRPDRSRGVTRTEARSKHGDSHLGHLFDDGPAPTGLRYCINSAALRFIPASRLAEEGYGRYIQLFTKSAARLLR